jgi:hypothetical protein
MSLFRRVWPIALVAASALPGQVASPAGRSVLFAFEQQPNGSFLLMPVFEVEQGRLHMPPEVDQGNNCRAFASEYNRAGRSYSVLFGGARAGTATMKGGGEATVSFARAVRLPRLGGSEGSGASEMALATDSKALGGATGSRRPPTAEERAAALSMVRAEYGKKGVPASMLAHVALEELISTDLNHDGAQDLIGAWRVDEAPLGRSHSLFFIAERRGTSYHLSLVKYQAGRGETYGFELPVDHVDLDGDGSDELITRDSGWEWYAYHVYSRRGTRWVPIYEGYGCEGM